MSVQYLLMAAQAAGMVGSIYGERKSWQVSKRASQLEQEQLDVRLDQERMASEERAVFNMERLSQTLSSQRVLLSKMGIADSPVQAGNVERRSMKDFYKEERARKLNLNFGEQQLNLEKRLSKERLKGQKPNYLLMGLEMASKFGNSSNMLAGKAGG